jgi:hypothetical protein
MTNDEIREFCLALLHADSESEVIDHLKRAGYWDDPKSWRVFGDIDGNFATIGNQQSRPEAALIERIGDGVDARLMNECLRRGIEKHGREGYNVPTRLEQMASAAWDECEKG